MGKHAFLIAAHNQPELLKKLLKVIDHNRVDIFLHLDKKSDLKEEDYEDIVKESKIFFLKRQPVIWGDYSQIDLTLNLINKATEEGKYDYYHFLSGADFPLKRIEEILLFYDRHQGQEFISCKPCNRLDRIQYYYCQKIQNPELRKRVNKYSLAIQRRIRINRLKNNELEIGIGSAWFDITDSLARYILSKRRFIKKMFAWGNCADEIFLQTIVLNSPFKEKIYVHNSINKIDSNLEKIYVNVLRHIIFEGPHPIIKTVENKEDLIKTDCLFARKFDYKNNPEIVDYLFTTIHKKDEKNREKKKNEC